MASRGSFRGSEWFNKIIDERTIEALGKKNYEFGLKYGRATDDKLLEYVRMCAENIGRSPSLGEVIGGSYIASRFGSWSIVISRAGLPRPSQPPKMENRKIYRDEFKRQAELFKQEKLQKKEDRKAKQEARKKEKEEVNSSLSNCDDKE